MSSDTKVLSEHERRIRQLERATPPHVVAAAASTSVTAEATARAAADNALDARLDAAEAKLATYPDDGSTVVTDDALDDKADKVTTLTAGNGLAIETGGTLGSNTRYGVLLDGATLTKSGSGLKVTNAAINNLSGTNSGDLSMGTFGTVPNANGGSISSQVLTLQPANGSSPGGISLAAQTLGGGIKTFATGSGQFTDTVVISASTHATSRRAGMMFGSWEVGQDRAGNGTLDYFWWKVGDTNAALALTSSALGPPVTAGGLTLGTVSLPWGQPFFLVAGTNATLATQSTNEIYLRNNTASGLSWLKFNFAGTHQAQVGADSGGSLFLKGNAHVNYDTGSTAFVHYWTFAASERMRLTSAALVPGTSGGTAIGTTSLRWATSYFTSLNANTAGSSITPNAWTNLSLGTNWTLNVSPYDFARYRLDVFGRLELEISVKYPGPTTAAWNNVIGNLPAGFRPAKKHRISGESGRGGNLNDVYCSIDVDTNGNIIVINNQQNTGTTTTYIVITTVIDLT